MSLALLVDVSGSMDVAAKRAAARDVVRQLLGWLTPGAGSRRACTRSTRSSRKCSRCGRRRPTCSTGMDALEPWGKTRLFDAIAETGRRLAATGAAAPRGGRADRRRRQRQPAHAGAKCRASPAASTCRSTSSSIVSPLDRVGQVDVERDRRAPGRSSGRRARQPGALDRRRHSRAGVAGRQRPRRRGRS